MPDDAAPRGYYDALRSASLMPGWNRPEPSIWPAPKPKLKVHVWRAAEAQAALLEAGRFVTTELAERRNLIMVNPVPGNGYATSRNLVAAYQLLMPGEKARSHRHTPNALRLVLDVGKGTYTVVDGSRIDMANGDLLLTPGWSWHGHASDSDRPGFWIDFLDVPFVQHIEAMFFEHHPDAFEQPTRSEPGSPFRIPLAEAVGSGPGFAEVEIGEGAMPTIGLFAQRLPTGVAGPRVKSTANSIYALVAGRVSVAIEGQAGAVLGRGDVMTVPLWTAHTLQGVEDAVLLRVTDQPLMDKLGFLRQG
jgi:gentisate 1,2-dioxygenase